MEQFNLISISEVILIWKEGLYEGFSGMNIKKLFFFFFFLIDFAVDIRI